MTQCHQHGRQKHHDSSPKAINKHRRESRSNDLRAHHDDASNSRVQPDIRFLKYLRSVEKHSVDASELEEEKLSQNDKESFARGLVSQVINDWEIWRIHLVMQHDLIDFLLAIKGLSSEVLDREPSFSKFILGDLLNEIEKMNELRGTRNLYQKHRWLWQQHEREAENQRNHTADDVQRHEVDKMTQREHENLAKVQNDLEQTQQTPTNLLGGDFPDVQRK